jgi:hypothetical protein
LVAATVPAFAIIFARRGKSPWLSLIGLLPFGFIILLWIVAVGTRDERKDRRLEEVFGGDNDRQQRMKRGD